MTETEKADLRARLRDRPGDFVGQEVVRLSTMPVLREGRLEPAPFVLRVYATWTPEGIQVMPGGFCRTSEHMDVRAISMGEDVRTADVWVIGAKPVERTTLLASKEDVKVRRMIGNLPGRAADNLFWLGRYMERAEATLRLVRSLCTSLMAPESALHNAGETLAVVHKLLIDFGALDEENKDSRALGAVLGALFDEDAFGSVVCLVRRARRTAASMRERLSADFWSLLRSLEQSLAAGATSPHSEVEALQQVEGGLQKLAALSGLVHENMNRTAGWRFLELGRRIERGINTCRIARALAHDGSDLDDLDLLLDLADSQITYRARYLVGLAHRPVLDMVILDPFNTRSLAFQVVAIKEHLSMLPTLQDDGMLEAPSRLVIALAAELETMDADRLTLRRMLDYERSLMDLSAAITERYFPKGANAAPTVKLVSLA